MKKKLLKLLAILIILYLFISAIYVLIYVDFETPPYIVGPGFSESKNILRIFMGLPPTFTTYEGVPPIYLIQVIVKITTGTILSIVLFKNKEHKN